MSEINLTETEREMVDALLERIAAGGVHKREIRAQIRAITDRAEKVQEHIQYYGPYGQRLSKPVIRMKHGAATPAKRQWLEDRAAYYLKEIAELERKADLYRFVLAHGDFPKGYRR